MDDRQVAGELLRLAKQLTAATGFTCTVGGGNRMLTVYLSNDYSFPAANIGHIQKMMGRFADDCKRKILDKLGVNYTDAGGKQPCMGSQGNAKTSVVLKYTVDIKVRSDEKARVILDALQNNINIGTFNDWTDGL